MSSIHQNLSDYNLDELNISAKWKIAILVSKWNHEITGGLYSGALSFLKELGIKDQQITSREVPGSYELPIGAQMIIESLNVDAVICLGCVIQGETKHFDFVCEAVSLGIKDVSLKYNKPVIFGVLTDNTIEQSIARSGGSLGNKGIEAAKSAVQMLMLRDGLDPNTGSGVGF